MTKSVFFAYQGRCKGSSDENVDAICSAIKTYNQHQKGFVAVSWEDYRKTAAINVEVMAAINDCNIFVCDLTYFNHNVFFELGFAIGKGKQILIFLNENIKDASSRYNNFMLKAIRYTPLSNAQAIVTALQQKNYESNLLKTLVNIENIEHDSNELLYIRSKFKNQPSIDLSEFIDSIREKQNISIVDDDTTEVSYRPINWYFQNIVKSKCLIIHLLGENIEDAFLENAKHAFLAGLALGLNRKVLLLAPAKFKAPLDYHDILVQYTTSIDLIESVSEWLKKEINTAVVKKQIPADESHVLNLIKLGIGCDVAEKEKGGLEEYFVETSSYYAALKQEKTILVGRKGSGKSAIYIRVLKELLKDKNNYIVALKPEAEELLEDVEMSFLFNSPASKKSFFTSVWKLVIFSKLAIFIFEKIANRPNQMVTTPEENNIIKFVKDNDILLKMNIYNHVLEINRRLNSAPGSTSPDILHDIYTNFLIPLINIIKLYFKSINTKYCKIIIVADNLDQTWNSTDTLDIQTELISTLLEIETKIKNEMVDSKGVNVEVKEIIFLRKDIFNYIRKNVIEPDKFTTMAHEINWEEYSNLLRKVIENRFKYILDLKNEEDVEKAWKDFFNFKEKQHPFIIIEDIITKRPRDIIYFVSLLFESAINKGIDKVDNSDLKYAIEGYTNFLNQNLIAETRAEFPDISEIITKLQEHHGVKLEYSKLLKILSSFNYSSIKADSLISVLFKNDYMLGFDNKINQPFSDIDTLRKKISEKKFFFFPNKVYVIANAKYYFIKNKGFSSF